MDAIAETVARALAEDVGSGDVTTAATVASNVRATALITQKAPGVIFGLLPAQLVFESLDPAISFEQLVDEGVWRERGEVARVTGSARALLTGERTALNFLQRLSGVATLAARCVSAVSEVMGDAGPVVLDTRKTTPGLRDLEKAAVAAGGATNHRAGLYDAILIKENHSALAGGVGAAVRGARELAPDWRSRWSAGRSPRSTRRWRPARRRCCWTTCRPTSCGLPSPTSAAAPTLEASGGITLETLKAVASTGVDFISMGAITHSAPALDLSLLLEPLP